MIGDIILWFKEKITQFFCIHDYKTDRIGVITGLFNGKICNKCNKYKII